MYVIFWPKYEFGFQCGFLKEKKKLKRERERERGEFRPLKYPAVTSKRKRPAAVQCPKCFKGFESEQPSEWSSSPGSLGMMIVVYLLGLQHSCGSWWHAVDTPVCVSMFVTDGNRESSIVCSYHWDGFSNITRNVQLFLLTTVTSLVLGSIWSLTYKDRKNELQTQKAAKVEKGRQEKKKAAAKRNRHTSSSSMRKEGLKNELPPYFWQTLIFYFLYFL